jgi:hypothetical protein
MIEDSITNFDSFQPQQELIASLWPADRVFSTFKRTFSVPTGWMVLAMRASGQASLFSAGAAVERGDITELLLIRAQPIQLDITYDDVPSSDKYTCTANVRIWVRFLNDSGDLASFRATVLGSQDKADAATLKRYLEWPMHGAITAFAEKRPAADLVDGKDAEALSALLDDRLEPALFGGGMQLYQPAQASFACEKLDAVRDATAHVTMRRELDDVLAEARAQQLEHLATCLEQLQALRAKTPDVPLAALIRTFEPSQRGQLYDALWSLQSGVDVTQWIAMVAGRDLMCFDPKMPDAAARHVPIQGPPGALRSVRTHQTAEGERLLLLGAARGVYVVGVDDLKVRRAYTFPPPTQKPLRGGVNAATATSNYLFATHSEVGLTAWAINQPDAPMFLFKPWTEVARAVRRVQVAAEHVIFTADSRVIACPVDDLSEASVREFRAGSGRILALHAVDRDLYAADEVGDVWHWRLDQPGRGKRLLAGNGSPIESLKHVVIAGVEHLVFAERGTPALQAMPVGDTYIQRFSTGDYPVRRCAVAPDLLVAVTDGRDRLLCWHPHDAKQPYATVPVTAQTGHLIQDVWLVTGR